MDEHDEEAQETPRDSMAQRARERLAAQERIRQQATWVDLQIRQAMERGDFDELPGLGKPIPDLDGKNDPDWWVKRMIEREKVTGVLPPALQVRKDDAELDGRLDALPSERQVRETVEEFNEAVRRARFQPLGGPPMITDPRDIETEVARWRARRDERRREREAQRRTEAVGDDRTPAPPRRPGLLRRRRRPGPPST